MCYCIVSFSGSNIVLRVPLPRPPPPSPLGQQQNNNTFLRKYIVVSITCRHRNVQCTLVLYFCTYLPIVLLATMADFARNASSV